MHKQFGQIPRTNRGAASKIAEAARHIESLLRQTDVDPERLLDSERFPRPGVNIPSADQSEELIEEIDSSLPPENGGQEDETYDGAVGGVVEGGIEYLAFYKSFRDVLKPPAVNRWGIFFIRKRCVALATDMSISMGEPFPDCLDALAAFLYSHELYHYRFDAHCLQMEATGGQAVYRPYRRLVANRPMAEWHEESVANFYGLRALRPRMSFAYHQSIRDYLWDLVAQSPGAYAGGVDRQQTFRKQQMTQQACTALGGGPAAWQDVLASVIRMGTNFSKSREPTLSSYLQPGHCPVYWIDWIKGRKSILVPSVASVAEVNNDFIKRYLAGVQDHQSNHGFYRIDNGEKVKLPNPHRADLTNREFHNIIAKAGMTSPQFWRERERTSIWRKGVPRSPILAPRTLLERASKHDD